MIRVGMLHTVASLADRFQRETSAARADLRIEHVVNPGLLADRIAGAPDTGVSEELRDDLAHLLTRAQRVLVTCSSLGGLVDEIVSETGWPVDRIDTAMAAEAGRRAAGGDIRVLATVTSTLGPTVDLVAGHAPGARVSATLVEGAYAALNGGDRQTHDRLVKEAVDEAVGAGSVVVLAQASMADAVGDSPVLTSPGSGLEAFLAKVPREG